MRLLAPTLYDVGYIAARMREDEIEQYLAFTGLAEYDPDVCAKMVIRTMGEVNFVICEDDGTPYCLGGYDEIRPKVWQTWMMGTPEGWEKHWRTITKASRNTMDYLLDTDRANRIQCYSLRTRTAAQEWYKRGLGMKFEGHVEKLFADGQDATCYVKLKE